MNCNPTIPVQDVAGKTVYMGVFTTFNARSVAFDFSVWASLGEGTFSVSLLRPGDTTPYAVAGLSIDGTLATWVFDATDTALAGYGRAFLSYVTANAMDMTVDFDVYIAQNSAPSGDTPPDPLETWYQQMLEAAAQAQTAAQSAEASASAAAESESTVEGYKVAAETAAQNAAASQALADQYAAAAAASANEAHKSREAIENIEASAVSLPPDSAATVEKAIADGKVKLTFGIPKGEKVESDIFWLNTTAENKIVETFDEIVAAYKAGKSIWVRDTHTLQPNVAIAPAFLVQPIYDGSNINGMLIVCGGTALGSSAIDTENVLINTTYYIIYDPSDPSPEVHFNLKIRMCAELGYSNTPNESRLNGSAGNSTSASPVDHIHPAPFPDWTSSIGKALFVNNDNETPSQAFEWRDVPNGDFTSKVGDFLRVAEVDSNNKPTKWITDSIANAKGVNF